MDASNWVSAVAISRWNTGGVGIAQTRSREIFHEGMEVLRKCWTEDRFSYRGKHCHFDDICARPKPLQKPTPPIYLACLSPETFEIAGRCGYNVLMSTVFGLTTELARRARQLPRIVHRHCSFRPSTRPLTQPPQPVVLPDRPCSYRPISAESHRNIV